MCYSVICSLLTFDDEGMGYKTFCRVRDLETFDSLQVLVFEIEVSRLHANNRGLLCAFFLSRAFEVRKDRRTLVHFLFFLYVQPKSVE